MILVYVVYHPRRQKEHNTVNYAESCLSGVLDWVFRRHGRRPGPPEGFSRSHTLLLKGLRKLVPSAPKRARLPILASRLRTIRRRLCLAGSARDRMLWAFFLCCWQSVRSVIESVLLTGSFVPFAPLPGALGI